MKKLMVMLTAAAAAFGLFADDYGKNAYKVPTDFVAGPTNIVGYTDDGQTSIYDASGTQEVLWFADNFPTNSGDLTSYEQPAEVAVDTVGADEVKVLKIEADTAYPMLRMFNKVTQTEVGKGEYTKTSVDIGTLGLFADTQIKLSASEEAPQDFNGKVAVWLQAIPEEKDSEGNVTVEGSTNLMVTCGVVDPETFQVATTPTNIAIAANGVTVKPEEWHRITIRSIKQIATDTNIKVPGFVIYVDGVLAQAAQGAYVLPSGLTDAAQKFATDRALFASASSEATTIQTLESVGIAGNGSLSYIDLTDAFNAPDFAQDPTEVLITWDEFVDTIMIGDVDITKDPKAINNTIVFSVTGFANKSASVAATVTYKQKYEGKNYRGKSIEDTGTAGILKNFNVTTVLAKNDNVTFDIGQFAVGGAVTITSEEDRDEATLEVDGVTYGPFPSLAEAFAILNEKGDAWTGKTANIKLFENATSADFGFGEDVYADVVIDLNGHTMECTDDAVKVIDAESGVTIIDTSVTGGGKIIGDIYIGYELNVNEAEGTLPIYIDGAITYLTSGQYPAAVNLYAGKYSNTNGLEASSIVKLGTEQMPMKWSDTQDEDGFWSLEFAGAFITVEDNIGVNYTFTTNGQTATSPAAIEYGMTAQVVATLKEGFAFKDVAAATAAGWVFTVDDTVATFNVAEIKDVAKGIKITIPETRQTGTVLIITDNGDETKTTNWVATIAAAVEAAADGDTIALLGNQVLAQWVGVDKDVTLDLNGFKVTAADPFAVGQDALFAVNRGGKLTITDGATGGEIDSGAVMCAIKLTQTKAKDYVDPAEYTADNKAILVVNGGTIKGFNYAIAGNGNAGRGNTEVTITGGTIMATAEDLNNAEKAACAIYNPQENSKLTITGGTISGYQSAVEVRAGTLSITGGSLEATATEYTVVKNGNGPSGTGAALVISEHTTKKGITAEVDAIENATLTGVKSVAIVNPQGNTDSEVAVTLGKATYTGDLEFSADAIATVTKTADCTLAAPEGYKWDKNGQLAKLFGGGSGTAADPYIIAEYDHLVELKDYVAAGKTTAGKFFKQTADITFPAVSETTPAWAGIGQAKGTTAFAGVYNGNEQKILNMTLNGNVEYAALFSHLDAATVSNLEVNIAGVVADDNAEIAVAGIAGYADHGVTLVDIKVTGTIGTDELPVNDNVSGIMCRATQDGTTVTTLTRVEFAGTINAKSRSVNRKVAGFCGCPYGKIIFNDCVMSGTVINNTEVTMTNEGGTGGFIAFGAYAGPGTAKCDITFNNCSITGTVTGNKKDIMGLFYGTNRGEASTIQGVNKVKVSTFETLPVLTADGTKDFNNSYGLADANDNTMIDVVAASATGVIAAGNTVYLLKSDLTPAYAFTDVGTIAFNTNLFEAAAFNVTGDPAAKFDITSADAEGVVTFTAAIKKYTVKFIQGLNGETTNDFEVAYGGAMPVTPEITPVAGYNANWDADPAGVTEVQSDLTFTAVYKPVTYTITFVSEKKDTTAPEATNYTVNTEFPMTLPDATTEMTGTQFVGWTNETITAATKTIQTNPLANFTLYAVWEQGGTDEVAEEIAEKVDEVPAGKETEVRNSMIAINEACGSVANGKAWIATVYGSGKVPGATLAAASAENIALAVANDLPITVEEPKFDVEASTVSEDTDNVAAFEFTLKDGTTAVELKAITAKVKAMVRYTSALGTTTPFHAATTDEVAVNADPVNGKIKAELKKTAANAGFMKVEPQPAN